MEALKYLAGIPSPLVGAMLSADTRRMRFTTIPLAPNPACRCRTNGGCGAAMKIDGDGGIWHHFRQV